MALIQIPESQTLRAGNLAAEFVDASLRYIRLNGVEVIRRIYVAVRDDHWNTIPPVVSELAVSSQPGRFEIRFTARHLEGPVNFSWQAFISGAADGEIRFQMTGQAASSFMRNRIGICVLHPIPGCSGLPCLVEHTDGSIENAAFPIEVAPYQPLLDVRALSYQIGSSAVRIHFEGDVFETEDQRNWGDASFKTYSATLALPIPVAVHPGDRVDQVAAVSMRIAAPIEIIVNSDLEAPVPQIGFLFQSGPVRQGAHVRVDVRFDDPNWPKKLGLAAECGQPLEIACFTNDPEQNFDSLRQALSSIGGIIARLLVYSQDGSTTPQDVVSAARQVFGPAVPVGGGTNANFAELNRNRMSGATADFLSWPVSPCVHGNEYYSIVANLAGPTDAVRTARGFAGSKPIVISSVVIPLILTRAAWTAILVKHLAFAGVVSVTLDQGAGPLVDLPLLSGGSLVYCQSTEPLSIDAAIHRGQDGSSVWIANFTNTQRQVTIAGHVCSVPPLSLSRRPFGP
jgi:D-apionolactonase